MRRLIDANALMDEFRTYMAERYDREKCVSDENCKTCDRECLWRRIVNKAPTVDAVEVVRCKDCKHYRQNPWSKEENMMCMCWCDWLATDPDDFCSYGERRTDDAEN